MQAAKTDRPGLEIEDTISEAAQKLDLSPESVCSGSRKNEVRRARAYVACMAVERVGHKGSEFARILRVHRVSVRQSVEREREIFRKMKSSPESG